MSCAEGQYSTSPAMHIYAVGQSTAANLGWSVGQLEPAVVSGVHAAGELLMKGILEGQCLQEC